MGVIGQKKKGKKMFGNKNGKGGNERCVIWSTLIGRRGDESKKKKKSSPPPSTVRQKEKKCSDFRCWLPSAEFWVIVDRVLFTESYRHYRVLPSWTKSYWVLPSFYLGFTWSTRLYWVIRIIKTVLPILPGFT